MKKRIRIVLTLVCVIGWLQTAAQTTATEETVVETKMIETLADTTITADSLFLPLDSLKFDKPIVVDTPYIPNYTPDPDRSLWLSILVPGLGQIYNRKYWKLPIIYGGILGLTYGISWNGTKYSQYGQAYQDLVSNNPNSKSYMDFFPPGTDESTIDKVWLEKVLKNKKDYFRKNRDMCVLSIIIVYGVGILDAYVDSSLHGFDMSPNLSMKVRPTLMQNTRNLTDIGFGLNCSITF